MGRLDSLPWDARHVARWSPVIEAHPASQALRVGIAAEAAMTRTKNGLPVQTLCVTAVSCPVWWRVVYDRHPTDPARPHGKTMLAPQLSGSAVECALPGCTAYTVPFRDHGGFPHTFCCLEHADKCMSSMDLAVACQVVATRMELADAHGWQLGRERLTRPAEMALLLGEMQYVHSRGFALNMDLFWRVTPVIRAYLRQSHDNEKNTNPF